MRNSSVVWIPVLLVGSMLYWTLALGFGGLSLMRATQNANPCFIDESVEASVHEGVSEYQSITVNLGDALDATGHSAVTVDLVSAPDDGDANEIAPAVAGEDRRGSGRRSRTDRGPGETAF